MNKIYFIFMSLTFTILLIGCNNKLANFSDDNLKVVNREVSFDKTTNTVFLNDKKGEGLAIIENLSFETGTIEIDLKGENIPGKSFVGIAFNIQNNKTYEAVYFRPFNFQSNEKLRREHSLQYIFQPNKTWDFLRENFEGKYEAEFPRQPSPEKWFTIRLLIDENNVQVYDSETNTRLLIIDRLTKPVSDKIALWTGNNSKGVFRNLKIID